MTAHHPQPRSELRELGVEYVPLDELFTRLLTFPNVLVTGHQAFFTEEALTDIAETTLSNLTAFARRHRGPPRGDRR